MHHGFLRKPKQEPIPNAIFVDESRNWTALHEAASTGDDKRLEVLLASNVDRMSKEFSYGNTPLHEAASRGFSRCVKLICTPPSLVKSHHKEKSKLKNRVVHTIEALHNSALGIGNNEGLSALHFAVQNGHNQCCRELLLAGADPDVYNNYGDTPLHTACRYGHAGAARILLSASCDPNKANLNGDTALHITCAMGRRKLTRILLESDAQIKIKNAQNETPRDITIRKNYFEILEILNSPKRIRNRREKSEKDVVHGEEAGKQKSNQLLAENPIKWSPYGCHYFPDPRVFPSPKLETLPKEPLSPGEQYFLDLAGNIHKGPVSVGNTCYCGPFFRHMENKLNCNRRSLKKYVHRTKERLGNKVQALAIKTNDQIEQLTRTMIADRIRCENKRLYLNEFLKRGERMRATLDIDSRRQPMLPMDRTLSRCRSLEMLGKLNAELRATKLPNSRSFDVLDGCKVELTEEDTNNYVATDEESEPEKQNTQNDPLVFDDLSAKNSVLEESRINNLKIDFLKVSERLGDLLEKTTLIMERDNEHGRNTQEDSGLFHYQPNGLAARNRQNVVCINQTFEENKQGGLTPADKESAASPMSGQYEFPPMQRRYPNSSETSNPSQHSNSWEYEASPTGSQPHHDLYKYYEYSVDNSSSMLQSVINALRKNDNPHKPESKDVCCLNKFGQLTEDKLCYKRPVVGTDELRAEDTRDRDYVNSRQTLYSPSAVIAKPNQSPYPLPPSNSVSLVQVSAEETPQKNSPLKSVRTVATTPDQPNVNGISEKKFEIRNCEVKCLKKSSTGQVKGMVALLQHKINSTLQWNDSEGVLVIPTEARPSPAQSTMPYSSNLLNNTHKMTSPDNLSHLPQQYWPVERTIPKDAYFHDLPNKSRSQNDNTSTNLGSTVAYDRRFTAYLPSNGIGNAKGSRMEHMEIGLPSAVSPNLYPKQQNSGFRDVTRRAEPANYQPGTPIIRTEPTHSNASNNVDSYSVNISSLV